MFFWERAGRGKWKEESQWRGRPANGKMTSLLTVTLSPLAALRQVSWFLEVLVWRCVCTTFLFRSWSFWRLVVCWSQVLSSWLGNHRGDESVLALNPFGDGRYCWFWVMWKSDVLFNVHRPGATALRRLDFVICNFRPPKCYWVRQGCSSETARESCH